MSFIIIWHSLRRLEIQTLQTSFYLERVKTKIKNRNEIHSIFHFIFHTPKSNFFGTNNKHIKNKISNEIYSWKFVFFNKTFIRKVRLNSRVSLFLFCMSLHNHIFFLETRHLSWGGISQIVEERKSYERVEMCWKFKFSFDDFEILMGGMNIL